MKSFLSLFIIFLLYSTGNIQAQQQYKIAGKTYSLHTEVEGPLTLLWNSIEGEYQYFVQKDNVIVALKNTKKEGNYQEEYKETLQHLTDDAIVSTAKVKFTLASLQAFCVEYNTKRDPSFNSNEKSIGLKLRLGVFAGVTNSIYTENPTNAIQPLAGVDLELIDNVKLKRHAMVVSFKQVFESSDYSYSASQLSLNYRFKFIKTSKFDLYVNCKFVSFTHSKKEVTYLTTDQPAPQVLITETRSGSDFNTPVTLGIGADYKIGNGFITFNYNDFVGLSVESNDEFPIAFTLGYKFNL